MLPDRRHFLEMVGIAAVAGSLPPRIGAVAEERSADVGTEPADYTIRIGTGTLELAPDHIVSTTVYNGSSPARSSASKKGSGRWSTSITTPTCRSSCTAEEGTPFVPARGYRRISFVPKPAGFRFYHTHVPARV